MSTAETVQSIVTSVAIVAGGAWAYFRYVYNRERNPRATLEIDVDLLGVQRDQWIVEVNAVVHNQGSVRHRVDDPRLEIRYLVADDRITDGDESVWSQTSFPNSIGRRSLPWGGYIDPGLKYRNSYLTHITTNATFGVALCSFKYTERGWLGRSTQRLPAQKVFAFPRELASTCSELVDDGRGASR
jgi:hypothetical protein